MEIWEAVSSKLILKIWGDNEHYVRLPFYWFRPSCGDIPWKRGSNRIRGLWFWNREWGTWWTLVLGVEENFVQNLPDFMLFFGDKKKKLLKALLTFTCIPRLMKSLDLSCYGSKYRKKYTLSIFVDVSRRGNDLPGRRLSLGGLGVSRKLYLIEYILVTQNFRYQVKNSSSTSDEKFCAFWSFTIIPKY